MPIVRNPRSPLADRLRKRIDREPSPGLASGVPWASVMLLSLVPFAPLVVSAPVMPPLAFMALLAWRMLRPGLLPVWAGAPLGAFDDLYSGQPFGSAIVLWSVVMIGLDYIDARLRPRGFAADWALAAAMVASYLLLAALIADATGGATPLVFVGPQILLAVATYPATIGLVALLDRLRLIPIRVIAR